jgi:hypothetical protein
LWGRHGQQQRYMSSVIRATKHGRISVSAALWDPFGAAGMHGPAGEASDFHTHIPVSHSGASDVGYGTSPPKKNIQPSPVCFGSFSPYIYCKMFLKEMTGLPIEHPLFVKLLRA